MPAPEDHRPPSDADDRPLGPDDATAPPPPPAPAGGADPDHPPSDADDRPVELDDPARPDPPVDDEDRDPARRDRPGG
jgi:hypothetical protein